MEKEDQILIKHLQDLSCRAYEKGIPVYSNFLNIHEISLLESIKNTLAVNVELFGGYAEAERCIACFVENNNHMSLNFPVLCIKIIPKNRKFSEALTHRDFLGAIINLGIERSQIGDLLLEEESCYLFCHQKMRAFIMENLLRVKHTNVVCEVYNTSDINIHPCYKEIEGSVSSIRLDAVLAVVFSASRSSLLSLIKSGKVFVNGSLNLNSSYIVKEGDIISVRGFGKFIYAGSDGQTRKGRYYIKVKKYV